MAAQNQDAVILDDAVVTVDVVTEVRRKEVLLKTGAIQRAIFNSANFSCIATDEKGVIQLFNWPKRELRSSSERLSPLGQSPHFPR